MGRPEYWTEDRIRDAAQGYEFVSDFAKDFEGAYSALKTRYQSLRQELFPVFKKLVWTKTKLVEEAKKYSRRIDFRNGSMGAYSRAHQIGVLDEICAHMLNGRIQGRFDLGEYVGTSGIYYLIQEGKVIYIGKSESCVVGRIRWHYERRDFDEVRIFPLTNTADILILEAYLVAKHKPVENLEFVTTDKPSVLIRDVAAIMGDPIIVSASFGVNGMNSWKGK